MVPVGLAEDDEGCTLVEVRIKREEAAWGEMSRGRAPQEAVAGQCRGGGGSERRRQLSWELQCCCVWWGRLKSGKAQFFSVHIPLENGSYR